MSINRLIAERVLGWSASVAKVPTLLPDWSQDIGACFAEIVPAMREKGWGFGLDISPGNDRWEAVLWRNDDDRYAGGVHGDPAMAICLAALRAVGVTDEDMGQ